MSKLLPVEYSRLGETELHERIRVARSHLGDRAIVLGHHYQRDEIIQYADVTGDSYKLANEALLKPTAEYIVFCGVHFMAESADIMTPDNQVVVLPNMAAGCSMADMANIFQVERCWKDLVEALDETVPAVPVTYINSAASLKAFVGDHGGTVCTSTNAPSALNWAFEQGSRVLFFPDQHLGRNTGVKMGISPTDEMCVWDPFKPLGGNTPETLRAAKIMLWKGHCSVHQRFTVGQIEKARREDPAVQVLVHPECPLEVVEASDFNGSTEFIIKKVTEAPAGSSWAVGTEVNLVSRLAKRFPDKRVTCLDPLVCPCSTMYRIHPTYLCWVLESLSRGEVINQVKVSDRIAVSARKALAQMLKIGSVDSARAG